MCLPGSVEQADVVSYLLSRNASLCSITWKNLNSGHEVRPFIHVSLSLDLQGEVGITAQLT